MDEDWIDVLYDKLIKVENEDKFYGEATFLVWHEAYGFFKVTEEIDSDGFDSVAERYKNDLEGTDYDFCSKSEDEWERRHYIISLQEYKRL